MTKGRRFNTCPPVLWVSTVLSQLTQVATGLANGDLSQTAQIQTRPLEINTKDGKQEK
jgi:hypothetical protein